MDECMHSLLKNKTKIDFQVPLDVENEYVPLKIPSNRAHTHTYILFDRVWCEPHAFGKSEKMKKTQMCWIIIRLYSQK